jgi:hypothetical protein
LTSLSPINMKLESPAEIYEIEDDTPNVWARGESLYCQMKNCLSTQ